MKRLKTKRPLEWRKYFKIPGMEVSENGDIRRYYNDDIDSLIKKRPPKYMKRQKDKEGNPIVRTRDHGNLRIDHLVETCFHGSIGQDHRVCHKDGNKDNCHKDNLTKIPIKDYNKLFRSASDWKECYSEEDEVEVNVKTKEIRQHGKVVPVQNEIYDPDTDCHVKVAPFVTLRIKNRFDKIESVRPTVDDLTQSAV